MSDTKLNTETIDWAVELIDEKEFLTLEKTGATICVMRLKDGTYVVGANAVSTAASDLDARYQSAFEVALKEALDVSRARGPFDDRQDKTAG
ncbi:hypothetical protein [Thiolapillus sp.]|uniref:hypothetical protein n=1 Tax=Thiolapillus sp. TaxID=2017437 RepID=UPI003AF45F00